jgi:hypothetical protein
MRPELCFERQHHLNGRPSISETAGKRSRPLRLMAPGVWPFTSKTIADTASMRQAISGDRQQVGVTTDDGGTMVLCWICAMSNSLSRSVDPSNLLLRRGSVPIKCPLRHKNSRLKTPLRNKREIKSQFETRLKRRLSGTWV